MSLRRKTILVVDQDNDTREAVVATLKRDYRVLRAWSGGAGAEILTKEEVDVLIAEVDLPDMTGIELLQVTRVNFPPHRDHHHLVIGQRRPRRAGDQARRLPLPDKADQPRCLRSIVRHAEEHASLSRRLMSLEDQEGEHSRHEFITGSSPAVREVLDTAKKVAKLRTTVLILGESGTGKELLARQLHRDSEHPDGPFVAVNMAAIPRDLVESTLFGHEKGSFTGALQQRIGKFELASGGTLFSTRSATCRSTCKPSCCVHPGERDRACRRRPAHSHVVPPDRRHQYRPRSGGEARQLSSDLYTAERHSAAPAATTRTRRRPALANRVLRPSLQHAFQEERGRDGGVDDTAALQPLVAATSASWRTWSNGWSPPPHGTGSPTRTCPSSSMSPDLDRTSSERSLLDRALMTFERNFIVRGLERSSWNVTQTARYLGRAAQHVEVQDGTAGDSRPGEETEGELAFPSDQSAPPGDLRTRPPGMASTSWATPSLSTA
jgi:two-component system NtrC family response regulator